MVVVVVVVARRRRADLLQLVEDLLLKVLEDDQALTSQRRDEARRFDGPVVGHGRRHSVLGLRRRHAVQVRVWPVQAGRQGRRRRRRRRRRRWRRRVSRLAAGHAIAVVAVRAVGRRREGVRWWPRRRRHRRRRRRRHAVERKEGRLGCTGGGGGGVGGQDGVEIVLRAEAVGALEEFAAGGRVARVFAVARPVLVQLLLRVREGAVGAARAAAAQQVAAQARLVLNAVRAVRRFRRSTAAAATAAAAAAAAASADADADADPAAAATTTAAAAAGAAAAVRRHKVDEAADDEPRRGQRRLALVPGRRRSLRTWVEGGQQFQTGAQVRQVVRVAGALQRDNQLLHRLAERLRRLQLVDDGLHVRLVRRVAVEQRRPLVGRDAQAGLGGDLHDLRVVLATQRLVRPKLLLQLHQRRVALSLGDWRRKTNKKTNQSPVSLAHQSKPTDQVCS